MSHQNVRNRVGWSPRNDSSRNSGNRPVGRREPRRKEILSIKIPVLVYRRRTFAKLNTYGQFSKISQELASYAITKGAIFQEVIYSYQEIRRRVNTIEVPVATAHGSVTRIKCIVDRGLLGTPLVLGLPAIRKMGYRIIVGNVSARLSVRTTRGAAQREVIQMGREISQPRARRESRPRQRATSALSSRSRGNNDSEDVIEGLSRQEMDEIAGWN